MTETLSFDDIFQAFADNGERLKVISVASSSADKRPNSAPKMLLVVKKPNLVYYLDFSSTKSYSNISKSHLVSVSFMDDADFTGYRLTGSCEMLTSGAEYDELVQLWNKRLIKYEADRIIQRVKGHESTREAENRLPADFVIVKMSADEASLVKPDRILRAYQ